MTVFIVQQPRPFRDRSTGQLKFPDLSPATTYGAVSFIFSDDDQPGLAPGPSLIKARKALADFSDDDYLCWAGGDPMGLSIASMVVAEKNRGRVKLLRWERNSKRMEGQGGAGGFYLPVDVRLHA